MFILKVEKGEYFPCDIVIIATSDKKSRAYIETKNLDGESNKKIRFAQKHLA